MMHGSWLRRAGECFAGVCVHVHLTSVLCGRQDMWAGNCFPVHHAVRGVCSPLFRDSVLCGGARAGLLTSRILSECPMLLVCLHLLLRYFSRPLSFSARLDYSSIFIFKKKYFIIVITKYTVFSHPSILYIILYPLWGQFVTLSKYIHVISCFEVFIETNLMVSYNNFLVS
jgi:hypothetical protein